MRRPTTMRVAFENAQVYPQTNRQCALRILQRLPESIGYVTYRPRKEFSDGPRPKGAPSVEDFFKVML